MTTTLDVQRALLARGYDIGKAGADGKIGKDTLGAMMAALERLPLVPDASAVPQVVPASWMPRALMLRIIVHWTAGSHTANSTDLKAYHLLIEGPGKLVRGIPSIDLNQAPPRTGYAAHTKNANGGSIGVSLCCMAGAIERPFSAGKYPLTREQWAMLPRVLADLCRFYQIPVTRSTVLSHAEVQAELGVVQAGKWDISRLPFDPSLTTARAIGDAFRSATAALL